MLSLFAYLAHNYGRRIESEHYSFAIIRYVMVAQHKFPQTNCYLPFLNLKITLVLKYCLT